MYDRDDFHDSMDDMCDKAVRRMFAFRESGVDKTMQPGDAYYSVIEKRDEILEVIEFDTVTKTQVIDTIHPDAIMGEMPDYFQDILAVAVIVLARHAAYLGKGSDIMIPSVEMAKDKVDEKLLLGRASLERERRLQIARYELGAIGMVGLVLEELGDNWQLQYEAHQRTNLIRF